MEEKRLFNFDISVIGKENDCLAFLKRLCRTDVENHFSNITFAVVVDKDVIIEDTIVNFLIKGECFGSIESNFIDNGLLIENAKELNLSVNIFDESKELMRCNFIKL